jgi:hypothetical protein
LTKVSFVDPAGQPIEGGAVTAALTKVAGGLPLSTLQVKRAGEVTETGDDATGAVEVGWTLAPDVPWSYRSAVRLTRRGRAAYARVHDILRDIEREWSDELGPKDFSRLKALLVRVWESALVR